MNAAARDEIFAMFPDVSRDTISEMFADCNFDVEQTVLQLLDFNTAATKKTNASLITSTPSHNNTAPSIENTMAPNAPQPAHISQTPVENTSEEWVRSIKRIEQLESDEEFARKLAASQQDEEYARQLDQEFRNQHVVAETNIYSGSHGNMHPQNSVHSHVSGIPNYPIGEKITQFGERAKTSIANMYSKIAETFKPKHNTSSNDEERYINLPDNHFEEFVNDSPASSPSIGRDGN